MEQPKIRLKVEKGPGQGEKHKLGAGRLVIGSDPGVDIVIEGPGVAARHAAIVFDGGQVRLEDLGTQAGTFRNGLRLLGPVQVFPGDRIGLGPEVVLILEGQDPKAGREEPADDLGLAPEEPG